MKLQQSVYYSSSPHPKPVSHVDAVIFAALSSDISLVCFPVNGSFRLGLIITSKKALSNNYMHYVIVTIKDQKKKEYAALIVTNV